jgi:hypothetical protein
VPGGGCAAGRVLRFSGTITGNLENATDFMTRLQEGKYPTLVITDCTVKRIDEVDVSGPGENALVMVNLSIALYVSSTAGGGGA